MNTVTRKFFFTQNKIIKTFIDVIRILRKFPSNFIRFFFKEISDHNTLKD